MSAACFSRRVLLSLAVSLFPAMALASTTTSTGFDTLNTSVPLIFAVGGQQIGSWDTNALSITTGSVGIGLASPQVPLDVNGPMRATSTAISSGASCSVEGSMGYDLANHAPVYCSQSLGSQSLVWTSFGGASQLNSVQSLGELCGSGTIKQYTYTNTHNYPVEIAIQATGSNYSDGGMGVESVCTKSGVCVAGNSTGLYANGFGQYATENSFSAMVPANGSATLFADRSCGTMSVLY